MSAPHGYVLPLIVDVLIFRSEQKRYAEEIKPIRKNGLLVTLLLLNMIVNKTLPVIADPVLGEAFRALWSAPYSSCCESQMCRSIL